MADDARAYVIEQRGSQWCLLTKDRSRTLGCHDSEAGAQAQERAVEASKAAAHTADLHAIRGVQIFRAGTWNGDAYSDEDLDAIATAAGAVGYGVPLKAGHSTEPGAPALGWVENVRRVGSSLYADLVDLPKRVYDAIKQRAYDAVSAEIFWDLRRNGAVYPRALKAVALLGSEIPAVDLEPLRAFLHAYLPPPADDAHAYNVDLVAPGRDFFITREMMQDLCPSCAESMKEKRITRLRIPFDADGVPDLSALRQYDVNQGLCDKFGEASGFRTRCMDWMMSKAGGGESQDYAGGFCNKLKEYCHGSVTKESSDPTETKTMDDKTPKTDPPKTDPPVTPDPPKTPDVPVKAGEIVVNLAQLEELRRKAARADKIDELQRQVDQEAARNAELVAQTRKDAVAAKMRSVKLPAFRPYIKALYEIAMESPEVKTYALTDEKVKLGAVSIVEALVIEMNRQADALFATYSQHQPQQRDVDDEPEEIQAKIRTRVAAYCKANKLDVKRDYKQALNAVLDADPSLRAQYSQT